MTKLDMAIYYKDGLVRAVYQRLSVGWFVWDEIDPGTLPMSPEQHRYETELSARNTMVLRGVSLDLNDTIESINHVEFESYEAIADYPKGFRNWLDEKCVVKPVWKDSLENVYTPVATVPDADPVTKPAGYQLASGNELKDVLPDLVGKDDTIAFYRGSAIKYLMRYQAKNGAEDLDKAVQYIGIIKELEYGVDNDEAY